MKKRKLPKKNCLYISTLYVLRKNQYEKSVFREQLCVPIGCEDVSVKNMEAIPLGSLVSRIYIYRTGTGLQITEIDLDRVSVSRLPTWTRIYIES
jgi:hypothetical protein